MSEPSVANSGGADKPLKILVSGDVEGKLGELYSKVKSIQSKVGKFDYLFCVGEFFAESPEDNKEIEEFCSNPSSIPIQTYVLGTNKKSREKYFLDKSGYDICSDKIIYLGSKGCYTTFQGLSLLYLAGSEGSGKTETAASKKFKSEDENSLVEFNADDVDNIISNSEKRNPGECVDILLTNQWPKFVENLSNQELENGQKSEKFGSELISYMAMRMKPRYHFSAIQNMFYERIPYRNHRILKEKEKHLTRFLALAKVNKTNKPKYLYAFNLTASKNLDYREVIKHSAANLATESPYNDRILLSSDGSLLPSIGKKEDPNSFFYDNEYIKHMNELEEIKMNKARRRMEQAQNREKEPCWFCLGGTKIERQYIISVGEKCYLAYAKGALNKDHLLIIPIDHVQSSINCDDELLEEINKFKTGLKNYFKSINKCVLFYERNFRSKHMQIQVFAIKMDKAFMLKDAFFSVAKDQSVRLDEIPAFTNLKQVLRSNQAYFYLELPADDDDEEYDSRKGPKRSQDEAKEEGKEISFERYLCEIRGPHFPLNFGRDVMASELLLNCPERIDWKECVKSEEEEKQMALEFRKKFAKFDPSV